VLKSINGGGEADLDTRALTSDEDIFDLDAAEPQQQPAYSQSVEDEILDADRRDRGSGIAADTAKRR
jgi:hypothetical protein